MKLKTPVWLGKEGKKEYKRMAILLTNEGKEFTEKDLKTLEIYADNYDKWLMCENFTKKNGFSFICSTGYPSPFPEVAISNKAQQQILICAKELGLTPAARARMNKNVSFVSPTEGYNKEDREMEDLISDD